MDLTYPGAIKYLPVKKANRIVIAKLVDNPGYAETLIVSDEEEDFVPLMSGMMGGVAIRTVSKAIDIAARLYEGFPISEVTISHSKMTAQEAYSVIMGKSVNIPPRKVLRKRRLNGFTRIVQMRHEKRTQKSIGRKNSGAMNHSGTEANRFSAPRDLYIRRCKSGAQ